MFNDPKFWLAISFTIFVVLLIKYVFPFIIRMIDNKAEKIAKDLKEANEMKKQAEKLLKDAEKYYKESVKHSEQLIKDAESESNKIAKDYKETLEKEIAKKIDASEERIKANEERIVREVKTQIIENAVGTITNNINNIADDKSMQEVTKNSINQISSKIVN